MSTKFARLQDAIPLVSTTAERGVRFPAPSAGQRVQNLETGAIERFSPGLGWITDILSGGGNGGITQAQADARYYQKTESDSRYISAATVAAGYAPIVHNHDDLYYGKAFADARYAMVGHNHDATYSAIGHNHDTRYYTQAQSDARYEPIGGGGSGSTPLASATTSGKVKTDITEADPLVYAKATVDGLLSGKANLAHTHSAVDINSGTLNVNRLGSSGTRDATTYLRGDNTWATVSATVPLATTATSGTVKTDVNQADPLIYVKSTVDTLLAAKANAAHTHAGTDITSGIIAAARLGTNTPDATKYLRGDGAWIPFPASSGGPTVPFDLSGAVAGPMATWENTSASGSGLKIVAQAGMFQNGYSYMATDATNTYRYFQVFGRDALVQIGRTPAPTKWFDPGVTTTAPVGSGGPVRGFAPGTGLLLHGTPGIGDAAIWFTNSGNTASDLKMMGFLSSGDGGLRFIGNGYLAPEIAASGTVARTALDTATFDSAATRNQLQIGDSIWVDVGGTIYGYTIRGFPSATTARLYAGDYGGTWTARSFTIRGLPHADRTRPQFKYGTDSLQSRWGMSMYQSPDSTYNADAWAMVKDFQLVIYPGGWDTGYGGTGGAFTNTTSIGLTGKGRRIEFFTSSTDNNDAFKAAMYINPWYEGFPSGGTVAIKGTLSAEGGSGGGVYGDRAPLNLLPMKDWYEIDNGVPRGRPAIWNNGDVYITAPTAGSPNKLRFIAGGNIYEVNATLIGPP